MNKQSKQPHVGQMIKNFVDNEGLSASRIAAKLPCTPANMCNIFKRRTIDIELLARISVLLNHNFIRDYAETLEL